MAKILKDAALIVGAVALVATGVGAAIGLTAGVAGATAAQGITAVSGLLSSTIGVGITGLEAISAGLGIAGGLLAKKPEVSAGGSQDKFTADPNAGVPYAMGLTGTAGNIVRRSSADGWAGENTPNDLNDFITILSLGPIQSYEGFTSDQTTVTFDGSGNAIGDYHDKMFQKTQRGLCPEASYLTVTAGSSIAPTGWTAAHKLSGLAATIWRLRYDTKQRFFQNGVPQPMWTIKGVRCYDPRQDDTYPGGSGSCRADDETTWVWSENPYVHAITWALGHHQNGKRVAGLGSPADQIVMDQFVEGANVADANGWTISGVVYTRPDTKWNVFKSILQAGAGEPLTVGARIGCLVNTPKVSLATITDADIVGDASLAGCQPMRNVLNTVTPSYLAPDQQWAIVPADPISVADYVTADGDQKSKAIPYPLVKTVDQAAQLARYDIENSRELGPGTFPLKPTWLNYKAGDCVTLATEDVASQPMLLLTREFDPSSSIVTFTMRSETAAKHAFALGQTGSAPPAPSISAPDPDVPPPADTDWALVGATLTANGASIPALVVTGAVGNSNANAVVFDFRVYDEDNGPDDNWIGASLEGPTTTRKEITGVTPGTQYEAGIRYRVRSVIGTERLILGPVTAGVLATARGAYNVKSQSEVYPLTSDDDSITIDAYDIVIDDGRSFSLTGTTIGSLSSGTDFGVFWKIADGSYQTEQYPADTHMASSDYVFLGWMVTSTSGTFPTPPTPPGGYGGGGSFPSLSNIVS